MAGVDGEEAVMPWSCAVSGRAVRRRRIKARLAAEGLRLRHVLAMLSPSESNCNLITALQQNRKLLISASALSGNCQGRQRTATWGVEGGWVMGGEEERVL